MFSFHKSDALPQSRQSSIDSPVNGPSTSDAGSDLWSPQASGPSSSHGGLHSPEQRQRTYSSKRSSVFTLRSRSNTASSTTPSLLSLSHPDMAEHEGSMHESPSFLQQFGGYTQNEPSSAGTRRSLFRGRKGKRLSEAVSPSIGVVDYKETVTGGKRTSVLRKGRGSNNQSESSFQNLRHRISSPFDFQHLSHTDRYQLAALEKASGDKLAAGFSGVRASQTPSHNLTGIKADDLHFSNFSSENLASPDNWPTSAPPFGSPPGSPEAPHEWQQSGPSLRLTRSVESFSQPGVSSRHHRHSQSVLAPPRFSSLPPTSNHDAPVTAYERGTSTRSKRESGVWDSFALGSGLGPEQLPGIQEGEAFLGHALTTPDDSAIHAMTPPFSPSLEDVDEEPERFVSPRPAPRPPIRTPTSPRSPKFDNFAFNNQRSTVTGSRSRGNSHSSPKSSNSRGSITRPMSQMSDTLGTGNLTRRGSIRRPPAIRRRSNTWRAIEESWEDDVDYIYENALEADCDFEWDRVSEDGSHQPDEREYSTKATYSKASQNFDTHSQVNDDHRGSSAQLRASDFRTSLLVPSANSLPDLVPTSALSTSTTDTGLPTPLDSYNANRFNVDEGFSLSPSLLIPEEYKDTSEVTYEDLLDEYDGSDRHFPMLDANQSTTSSARSSRVRSSRRSSYDSSLISSAQSSGLWSSPVRRSASSAGSVPELVPSRRTRKDLGFSLIVDKLSEQVASLRQYDDENEDEDITPPGRAFDGRTFFAAEDESPPMEQPHTSIESELRTSLELARRGSQRNERTVLDGEQKSSVEIARQGSQRSIRGSGRHHKQALSDSAAKILAPTSERADERPIKLRSRAATTTHARQPMLSLFPTPPRHSPTPNRI